MQCSSTQNSELDHKAPESSAVHSRRINSCSEWTNICSIRYRLGLSRYVPKYFSLDFRLQTRKKHRAGACSRFPSSSWCTLTLQFLFLVCLSTSSTVHWHRTACINCIGQMRYLKNFELPVERELIWTAYNIMNLANLTDIVISRTSLEIVLYKVWLGQPIFCLSATDLILFLDSSVIFWKQFEIQCERTIGETFQNKIWIYKCQQSGIKLPAHINMTDAAFVLSMDVLWCFWWNLYSLRFVGYPSIFPSFQYSWLFSINATKVLNFRSPICKPDIWCLSWGYQGRVAIRQSQNTFISWKRAGSMRICKLTFHL